MNDFSDLNPMAFGLIMKDFQNSFNHVIDILKIMPEATKVLAEHGWYLSMIFRPGEINLKVVKEDFELIENEMVQALDRYIDNIESDLIQKFPNRKNAIQAAIRAHKNQEFYLSIPVFFAQTEGICKELLGVRFFKIRNDSSPATDTCLSEIDKRDFINLFLEPLKIAGISRKKQNSDMPIGLNRHDVLHGDSTDYGSDRVNSYKALSLMNYIGETVWKAKEYSKKYSSDFTESDNK
jgi:hypothetical protein